MLIVLLQPIGEMGKVGYYKQQMNKFTSHEKQEYFIKGNSLLKKGKIEIYDVKNLRKEENFPYRGNRYKKYYIFDYVDKEGKTISNISIRENYYADIIIGDSNKYIVEYNDMYTFYCLQLTQETYDKLEKEMKKKEPSVKF